MRRIYGRERARHSHENSLKNQVNNCDLSKFQRRIAREDTPIRLEISALTNKDMLRVSEGFVAKVERTIF